MGVIDRIELWYRRRRMRFEESQIDSFYEGFFDDREWKVQTFDVSPFLIRKSISDYLEGLTNKVIVDVGCGLGVIGNSLDSECNLVCGCDISKRTLEKAKHFSKNKVEFISASIYEMPFKDETVDIVICLDVLEHLFDENRALLEVQRILKAGGVLFVRVPRRLYTEAYREAYGHLRHYSKEKLTALLDKNGFKVEATLHMFPWFDEVNRYVYAFITVLNMILSRVTGSDKTFYERRIGGLKIYQQVIFPILMWMSNIDKRYTEKHDKKRSTFLVAKKNVYNQI